jgi:tetratricopeptide (TPR) repeat protein
MALSPAASASSPSPTPRSPTCFRRKVTEALKSYRDSLATGDRLAKADPTNTDWQSYLSVSYQRVGEVLQAQGNLAEALKSYHDSLANCRPPGQGRPLQYRLAKTVVLYVALGDVLQA